MNSNNKNIRLVLSEYGGGLKNNTIGYFRIEDT